jgi:GntR family transcriptional regulator
MRIEVIRNSREPMFAQIVRQVRAAIVSEEFTPGCRLPSHKEVARVLGVSHATVRRSYRELQRAGLVRSERGGGTFVAETLTPAASPLFARARIASLVDALMVEAGREGLTLEEILEHLEWSAGCHGLQRRPGDPELCQPVEAGADATRPVAEPVPLPSLRGRRARA